MPDVSARHDGWQQGQGYEAYMGRWSRLVGAEFLGWLDAPTGWSWLDVGCGTGALAEHIAALRPRTVTGLDASPGFVSAAAAGVAGGTFLVGDAMALPFADHTFDAVVSGLALNFVPDPAAALAEMRRVTRAGGTVAIYLWDYADGMQMIRRFWDVAVALDPSAAPLDEATRFPLCTPDAMADRFRSAGLAGETTSIEIVTRFDTFEEMWGPFLAGQGPAPGYVASLSEDAREALRQKLEMVVASSGGTIQLPARAWAVRATA